jgi:YEATS family
VTLAIAQSHEYVGNDFWRWRAWIDGKPAELDRIDKVKWFLHPSFPESVIVSRDRSTGFRLETGGWGTFTLRAEAHGVDGSVQTLRQALKLYYPDEASASRVRSGGTPGVRPPVADTATQAGREAEPGVHKVFLSYAAADRRPAVALLVALKGLGLEVLDDAEIDPDQPFELAARDLLNNADATVAYVSSELPSAFVAQAVNASAKAGKPTVVLTAEALGPIAGVPSEVPVLRLGDPDAGDRFARVLRLDDRKAGGLLMAAMHVATRLAR